MFILHCQWRDKFGQQKTRLMGIAEIVLDFGKYRKAVVKTHFGFEVDYVDAYDSFLV